MSRKMDILKPELVWIEGRCYRLNEPATEIKTFQEHDLYEEEVIFADDADEDDDDIEVEMINPSRFSASCHVSKHYLGSIIGKKGATKIRIERDTNTHIKIPRPGADGDVVVIGPSAANVKAAIRRINIIVIASRMRQRSTHFLSIPISSPEIYRNFEIFQDLVLRECPDRGVEESIFIGAKKLHVTVGVMSLMDNVERQDAAKLLTSAKQHIIVPLIKPYLPFGIRVKGLSYMNDDPKEINVLYGCVQELNAPEGTLQTLVDSLVDYFSKAGFMEREHGRDKVKLHITLMNTKYRTTSEENLTKEDGSNTKAAGKRSTFDGSRILEQFGDYDFGVANITDIHLSQRHSAGPDGYYQPTCIITCCTF